MRIGVLTGGGDCPGLNAVIRALVRKGVPEYDFEFLGFRDGWRGPLEGDTVPLDIQAVRGILPRGGTILGSSRTNPFKIDGGPERCIATLADLCRLEDRDASLVRAAIGRVDRIDVREILRDQCDAL